MGPHETDQMNELKQTSHQPGATLAMESTTGQRMLVPVAITTLTFLTRTHGGPPQIESVSFKWTPQEMRDFAAKIGKVADELDQVIAPLGKPAALTRSQAFDVVAELVKKEGELKRASFEAGIPIQASILTGQAMLSAAGWNFEELKREIGADVQDDYDALERARKIHALTCELGRLADPESDEGKSLRKEIANGALALQAADYDVEKLVLSVALKQPCQDAGCGCDPGRPQPIQAEPREEYHVQIGQDVFTFLARPKGPLDVQIGQTVRETAQNLRLAAEARGHLIESWEEGGQITVRPLRHPLDAMMTTVTHWRIQDGDGEELILRGTEDESRALAVEQLLGGDPPPDTPKIEAVKTVAMKEMDFRNLREFQG